MALTPEETEALKAGPIDELTEQELDKRLDWAFCEATGAAFFSGVAATAGAVLYVGGAKARRAALICVDGLESAGCPASRVAVMRRLGRD